MSIDPRLLSTPIGAVIGLVIAKKALKPDDRTVGNLIIGAGLGAGAGYLTGQYIRGEQLSVGNVTEDKLRQNIRRNALGEVSGGTPAQIAALEKHTPGGTLFPGTPVKERSGWPWQRLQHNFLAQDGITGAVQQGAWHRANVQELTRTLKNNSNLSASQRNKMRSNIAKHQRIADDHNSHIRWSVVKGSGHLAWFKTIKDYIADIM
jgi:hypothetical protein